MLGVLAGSVCVAAYLLGKYLERKRWAAKPTYLYNCSPDERRKRQWKE